MPRKPWATICVGSYTVPIYLTKNLKEGKQDCYGVADTGGNFPSIQIRPGLAVDRHNETLTHEVLHMCADMVGVPLKEPQVHALGLLLTQAAKTFKLIKSKRRGKR